MNEHVFEAGLISAVGRNRTQRRFSRKERAQLLRRYASSGVSQKRFSQENGLAISTLTYWLRKSREGAYYGDAGAIVDISDQVLGGSWSGAQARPMGSIVRVHLPNEVELNIPTGTDAAWIAELARGLLTCSR